MTKNKTDEFGFSREYQYDRTVNFPSDSDGSSSLFRTKNAKGIIMWILIIILSLFIIGFFSVSGYIAWNEFTNDPIWLKIGKTYIAVMFAPAFLTYIFFKSIVFGIPT